MHAWLMQGIPESMLSSELGAMPTTERVGAINRLLRVDRIQLLEINGKPAYREMKADEAARCAPGQVHPASRSWARRASPARLQSVQGLLPPGTKAAYLSCVGVHTHRAWRMGAEVQGEGGRAGLRCCSRVGAV